MRQKESRSWSFRNRAVTIYVITTCFHFFVALMWGQQWTLWALEMYHYHLTLLCCTYLSIFYLFSDVTVFFMENVYILSDCQVKVFLSKFFFLCSAVVSLFRRCAGWSHSSLQLSALNTVALWDYSIPLLLLKSKKGGRENLIENKTWLLPPCHNDENDDVVL